MIQIPLVVNTHSKNSDVWDPFYRSLRKYWHGPVITFANEDMTSQLFSKLQGLYHDHEIVTYCPDDRFRTQYLKCLKTLRSYDAIIIANEDYILTGPVDQDKINNDYYMLANSDFSVFRYVIGPQSKFELIEGQDEYVEISNETPYIFSQTLSIWKVKEFIKIHELTPDSDIAGSDMNQQFEVLANDTFCEMGLKCMARCPPNEEPRGMYHYDCVEVPHICTAIIKGKWNLKEYPVELGLILREEGIDPEIRGTV